MQGLSYHLSSSLGSVQKLIKSQECLEINKTSVTLLLILIWHLGWIGQKTQNLKVQVVRARIVGNFPNHGRDQQERIWLLLEWLC